MPKYDSSRRICCLSSYPKNSIQQLDNQGLNSPSL